jgi:hypothetical protein
MVSHMEVMDNLEAAVCGRNYVDADGTVLAHPNPLFKGVIDNKVFAGQDLVDMSLAFHTNLYGDLSALMVRTQYAQSLAEPDIMASDRIWRVELLYHFLLDATVGCMCHPYTAVIVQPYDAAAAMPGDDFETYSRALISCGRLEPSRVQVPQYVKPDHIDKNITFFYTDKGEYYNLEPIEREAKRRGYTTHFTEDLQEAAEIGIYCQHATMISPNNAKFSVILLHDMSQGHDRWPGFWEVEQWSGFDIGILPGRKWTNLWVQSGGFDYANPRCGVFELGYPKSDLISDRGLIDHAKIAADRLNFKYEYTILYAPSWERYGKEDIFVKQLASLPVNLLIKQAHFPEGHGYEETIENIKAMRHMHEGKYENIYYLEPEESIMTALALCDMVVSDHSSVMAEATMFGKPSIAVTDWDTDPYTHEDVPVPMDFVIKCKKDELRVTVEALMSNPGQFEDCLSRGEDNFSNIGHVCSDILDAIEYYAFPGADENVKGEMPFMSKRVTQLYETQSFWN